MLIKFFATGTGDGKGPTDYCCNTEVPTIISTLNSVTKRMNSRVLRDENGKPVIKIRRPPPEILAGDRDVTRTLIDSLPFRWRYSSGVIAFAPEDHPSEEQQRQLMTDFECLAFAGLDRESYDILWIRHTHEGVPELHFVIPRIDLLSGKSYNPAPPGWERSYALLRNAWNHEQGWARPDDPMRARALQPGLAALRQAENFRAQLTDADDPKALITDYLLACIEVGLIKDRGDILGKLQESGMTINRRGEDYISVKPNADAKPIRLKGAIYQKAFTAEGYLKTQAARLHAQSSITEPIEPNPLSASINAEQAVLARNSLALEIQKRAHYNAKRYGQSSALTDKHPGFVQSMPELENIEVMRAEPTEISDVYLSKPWTLPQQMVQTTSQTKPSTKQTNTPFASVADEDDAKNQRNRRHWWRRIKDDYERFGKTITACLATISAAIQCGYDANRNAERQAESASQRLDESIEQIIATSRTLDSISNSDSAETMDKYGQIIHKPSTNNLKHSLSILVTNLEQ